MKYNLKYCVNISCVVCFKISQHEIIPSCFFCSIFHDNFVANVHLKVHPFYFSSKNSSEKIVHPCMVKYFSMSPNILSYVSNNIMLTSTRYSLKDSLGSFVHTHVLTTHVHMLTR